MTIRDDILAVINATGKPVQAREIARVLSLTTQSVASHLGYMMKEGVVRKRSIVVGHPIQRGPYIFPEATTVLWATKQTWPVMKQVCSDARIHKILPRAVKPRRRGPHTDDMIQMLEDLR